MTEKLRENLVFLTENITNLAKILVYLTQERIISQDESDEINAEKTPQQRNVKLLSTIQKKDLTTTKSYFLEILRKTNNENCANRIDGVACDNKRNLQHPKVLKSKWWPDKKLLIKSLYRRKCGSKLLVEELHNRILTEENQMVVICESATALKYSGMGGMGKTLTAKWYAHEYEQEYDHIIWIDCGEGSLITSFESLARDLEVKHLEKLKLKEIAVKSFDELTEFKCLWIYDNAENYKGEGGIINILPKYRENFYCIITSRSRDWGTKNIGFGKISALELDIFSDEESQAFLKSTLNGSVEHTNSQLKELGRLMGNLPLALQLTVAALIDGKIDLQNYIEKTSLEDVGNIVDEEFDDYEKTINKNVRISMDLISRQENGQLARDILIILGYIRPDDVRSKFLMKVLNSDEASLFKAIVLLEKYNLVTITKKVMNICEEPEMFNIRRRRRIEGDDYEEVEIVLNIHRLLQQVIRHNGREAEEETLRSILGCEGFIDYKLLPFTKYSNVKLQKEFLKVKAELLDQWQLNKLIREDRIEESVQLAKFICEELKTKTAIFNYAICLAKNQELQESVDILENLATKEMKENGEYHKNDFEMDLLKLQKEVSRALICGSLLILLWRIDNRKRIKELVENTKEFKIIPSSESLYILLRIIHSGLIDCNYSLVKRSSAFTFQLGTKSKQMYLKGCSLDLFSFDQFSPDELTLFDVSFTRGGQELEGVTVNEFIDLKKISQLTLNCEFENNTKMSIELTGNISLEDLWLCNVEVLGWKESKWKVKRLMLEHVDFVEKTNMTIKDIQFRNVSTLVVSCLPQSIQKLYLDRTEEWFMTASEEIYLPNLKYLTLSEMSDSSILSSFASVNITHIHLKWINEINVDHLPESVTHIKITRDFVSSTIIVGEVRKVDKVILQHFSYPLVEEMLSHFQTNDLVLDCKYGITPKEFIRLIDTGIKTITVGEVNWLKQDFSILSNHVDKKEEFYFWEDGKGRGIDGDEFEELKELY